MHFLNISVLKQRQKSSRMVRNFYHLLCAIGINPLKFASFFSQLPRYFADYLKIKQAALSPNSEFKSLFLMPCLSDSFEQSGEAKGHYFHQDLLVAAKIFKSQPNLHVDIGSRVDGFVAHVASFRKIEVFDIRPMRSHANNIRFIQVDMMAPLPNEYYNYCDSLSCLHALEHFGLGRYSDKINFHGHLMGWENFNGLLKSGGKLYLSVPIGSQRIEFNAHRVFNIKTILDLARGSFVLDSFSYVDDKGILHESVEISDTEVQRNFGCWYGCGIFEFTKNDN